MNTRCFGSAAIVLCGLTISLLAAPGAHAQGQAIATAQGDASPSVVVLTDVAAGRPGQYDANASRAMRDRLANTTWTLRNDGLIVASKGQEVLLATFFYQDSDTPNYVLHTRGDGYLLDGWLKGTGAGRGSIQLAMTFFASNGTSTTINYEASLSNFSFMGAVGAGR
jgi:hypothetical protein